MLFKYAVLFSFTSIFFMCFHRYYVCHPDFKISGFIRFYNFNQIKYPAPNYRKKKVGDPSPLPSTGMMAMVNEIEFKWEDATRWG